MSNSFLAKPSSTKQRALRFAIGVALFASLFFLVDPAQLLAILSQVRLVFIWWLIVLSVVLIWISCLKWRLFLRAHGREAPIGLLMRLYTVGYFFNMFMPSFVGGDIARSLELSRTIQSRKDAFVSTILERFTGFVAMAFLGVAFAVAGAGVTAGLQGAIYIVGIVSLVASAICFSSTCSKLAQLSVQRVCRLNLCLRFGPAVEQFAAKILNAFSAARDQKNLFMRAMLLSLAFHLFTVINTYVAALAIGWDSVDLSQLFVVVPLVLLITMIPLTPNGIGIQEGGFLFLLERIGANHEQALAVGLILRAKVILIAMLGGLLWMLKHRGDSNLTREHDAVNVVEVQEIAASSERVEPGI